MEEYRRKRLAEMQKLALKQKFGFLKEVTRADWKTEINEAGDLHIVIHIASQGSQI
ncbi:unnamed protein product [Protopolystoma xenopodis]|uniref:Uncharacterized protein n=1 Tax=Protopolystoma xenopodis TaxID=117903 RepID=A0A448XQW1_9PLAT|nr:unnamed protein product [Protopolystoma xenopodis]